MKVEVEGNKIVIELTDRESKYMDDILGEIEYIRKFIDILVNRGLD